MLVLCLCTYELWMSGGKGGISLLYRCATTYHVTPLMGHHICIEKWVQMTESKKLRLNLLIFARLTY